LPGRFPRAIDIKDHPGTTCSIRQTASLIARSERAAEQIIEEKGAQDFHRGFAERRQKARES
jgi:hypothetical protein